MLFSGDMELPEFRGPVFLKRATFETSKGHGTSKADIDGFLYLGLNRVAPQRFGIEPRWSLDCGPRFCLQWTSMGPSYSFLEHRRVGFEPPRSPDDGYISFGQWLNMLCWLFYDQNKVFIMVDRLIIRWVNGHSNIFHGEQQSISRWNHHMKKTRIWPGWGWQHLLF